MNKLLIAAPASGSGKTTVVCALLAALKRRGLATHAFKCGPDYIDPMFHRAVTGVPCRNLDLYLTGEDRLRDLFCAYAEGADAVVVEGVMGYYDGVGMTREASAWHVANVLDLPVVLVVKPQGDAPATVSQVRELAGPDSRIAAVVLNDCSAEQFAELAPAIEADTGLPVTGHLPHLEEAVIESRHLGLQQAEEIPDLREKLDLLADAAEATLGLDRLLELTEGDPIPVSGADNRPAAAARVAVASDEAFRFCYEETMDAFREAGLEPVSFSPLRDRVLPDDIDALYLPGGYPELYAEQLSNNTPMLTAVREAVQSGLPTIAECGGFLYLSDTLEDPDGQAWDMAKAVPGAGVKTGKLVRFGYAALTADTDTLIAPAGQPVRIHNFHHWDQTERGSCYRAVKPVSGKEYDTGYGTATLYAAFPHLYFAGNPALTERFAAAAIDHRYDRCRRLAKEKWNACAKPLGSLGVLEDMVVDICALTGSLSPSIEKRTVVVFCADNGVVEEGVTQAGQDVTRAVYEQMKLGNSSINNFARVAHADVVVLDAGMAPNGTANLRREPAMTKEQLDAALELGRRTAHELADAGVGLLVAGEMGIGNTTTSSAITAVLCGADVETVTGRGAGLTTEALKTKVDVIKDAIALHHPDPDDPYEVLRTLGGFDIAGMCGLYLGAAEAGIPVLADGFPSTVAALCAIRMKEDARNAILLSHVSAEPAGQMVVEAIGKTAPIAAGLRLGEGTGAVAAIPLLDMAFAEFNEGYTFDEGGIAAYEELQ